MKNLLEIYNKYKDILNEAWSSMATEDTEENVEQELNKTILNHETLINFLEEFQGIILLQNTPDFKIIQKHVLLDEDGYLANLGEDDAKPSNVEIDCHLSYIGFGNFNFKKNYSKKRYISIGVIIDNALEFQEDIIGEEICIIYQFNEQKKVFDFCYSNDLEGNIDDSAFKLLNFATSLIYENGKFDIENTPDEITYKKPKINEAWSNISTEDTEDDIENNFSDQIKGVNFISLFEQAIKEKCLRYKKILETDPNTGKTYYKRDANGDYCLDKSKSDYYLYTNILPEINKLLTDRCKYNDIYIYFNLKRKSLSVNLASENYYGISLKRISEIKIDENTINLIIEELKDYDENSHSKDFSSKLDKLKDKSKVTIHSFKNPDLIPYFAKVLAGIFCKFGDTKSSKKKYKDAGLFDDFDINLGNLEDHIIYEITAEKREEMINKFKEYLNS